MPEIIIPYKPRNWAMELHNSVKRWNVLVLHRRAGKTTAAINHLQRDALRKEESNFAYVAPTYKMAKRIAWEMLKQFAPKQFSKPNESELIMKYANGSRLYLLGSDNIDSLRGIGLDGTVLDENSQQPSGLFGEVISKCLADKLGYCIWLGTPKGKNSFHDTYKIAKENPNEYTSIFRTIKDSLKYENGKVIENLRQAYEDDKKLVKLGQMTEEELLQEWLCSWEAAIKGAYYAKEIARARNDGRIRPIGYDRLLKVHTVWDLGVGKNLAIGFYQRVGNEPRMIDYWEGLHSEGIPEAKKMLDAKPYVYGKHFAPHDIRATEIGTGLTRLETAKKLGIEFDIAPDMSVDDGINAGRLFFDRLFINEKLCEKWLDAMPLYRQDYDEEKGIYRPKPIHDWTSHKADVHRYAALVENQMTNETQKHKKAPPPSAPRSKYQGGNNEETNPSSGKINVRWR